MPSSWNSEAVQAGQDHDDAHHGVADRAESRDSDDSPEPQMAAIVRLP